MVTLSPAISPQITRIDSEVVIDVKALKLEKSSWFDSLLKTLIINPVLNFIFGPSVVGFFKKVTRNQILANLHGPGSWQSMLAHYDAAPKSMFDFMIDRYIAFPSALRNRQKLVVSALTQLIEAYGKNEPVNLLAIGCGSANNILKAIKLEKSKLNGLKAQLFDFNEDALIEGRSKARELGLEKDVDFVCSDANHVEEKVAAPPQIVKMIGLIEYLSDENVIRLFQSIKKFRSPASSILISSIEPRHGIERFLRRTLNFNLNYRSPEKLKQLLSGIGYTKFNTFSEPTGIFNVIVGHV